MNVIDIAFTLILLVPLLVMFIYNEVRISKKGGHSWSWADWLDKRAEKEYLCK